MDKDWGAEAKTYQLESRATNPLFNGNKLKLGVFCLNTAGSMAFTQLPTTEVSWPNMRRVAQLVDEAAWEAIVPIGRWRGFGPDNRLEGRSYETFTFAAGLGAGTSRPAVFATCHLPAFHPVVAAKQAMTVDHISGGRFTLNIVCGWSEVEFEMFGTNLLPHDERYEYAEEWVQIVRRLWSSHDEFDYDGRYFHIKKGFLQPKPVQAPMPPIMNAGASARGKRFMAEYADIAFTSFRDGVEQGVRDLRQLAWDEFHREINVWGSGGNVFCAPTEKEARRLAEKQLVEHLDVEALMDWNYQHGTLDRALSPAAAAQETRDRARFTAQHSPLVGTPEQIATHLQTLSQAGLDGVVLFWADYEHGVSQWNREVMPLLHQAGLRKPPNES